MSRRRESWCSKRMDRVSTGSDGTDTGTDTGTAEDPSLSLSGQFWVFPRGTKCEVTLLLKPNTNKLVCVSSE